MIITKCRIANLPYHPSPKIWHILLGKPERLLTPWKSLQELASEYTTVKSILLLRCRLRNHQISQSVLYVRKKYKRLEPSFSSLWNRKAFSSCSCVRHWYKTVDAFGPGVKQLEAYLGLKFLPWRPFPLRCPYCHKTQLSFPWSWLLQLSNVHFDDSQGLEWYPC